MACNGLGGAWLTFGGPIMSEMWFPSHERTTATAIASIAPYTGSALGFVLGPAIVGSPAITSAARRAVFRLFYGEAALCVGCALMCFAYFPDRPLRPPSVAALAKRNAEESLGAVQDDPLYVDEAGDTSSTGVSNFPTGLSAFFVCDPKVGKYWVISLSMAVPLGIFQGWNSTLFSCLKPLDVTQQEASWLGFFTTVVGCLSSVLVGAVLDRFAGRLKLVLSGLLLSATASFLLFGINAAGYLDVGHGTQLMVAYATSITGGACLNVTVPLFFELVMESVYGWGDESLGSMVTTLINVMVQIAFLVVLAETDPNMSKLWTSWALAAGIGVGFISMLFLRVDYRRLSVDKGTALDKTGSGFDRMGCY
jgi:FLVCR family MFS transporter